MLLADKFGRAITDPRISIADRSNYKCVYCRGGNEGAIYEERPFSEHLRIVRLFAGLGIRKGASDGELTEFIRNAVSRKEARHHIGESGFVPPSRTMVHLGG
jgi:molybdenum cofactor biosynthesis enzyme MoaA